MEDQSGPVISYRRSAKIHPATENGGAAINNPTNHGQNPNCSPPVMLMILLALAIQGFILTYFLILRPLDPTLRLHSAALTLPNVTATTGDQILADWAVAFALGNPNPKTTLFYDHITASLSQGKRRLGKTTIGSFSHGYKNVTVLRAEFTNVLARVEDWITKDVEENWVSRVLRFDLKFTARVRAKGSGKLFLFESFQFNCKDLKLGFLSHNATATLLSCSGVCDSVGFTI
ncbi:NDR1/HIN1-like protein 10 [Actinidia eriantha]|uniref:NDR1/HIN1-like protein 10 n=1 Tax=Actinidia eriantha TaxID=165200 RepID=UPI00258CBA26|nr:NDR1/HIN1-like protein 10 [Actinidia eriantha]